MADKLVNSTKLDACLDAEADAIRAKTGGSADIPFDFANNKGFADAIAAIPSGGGAKILTKLGTVTVTEAVATISISATEQMRSCEMLYIECDNLSHTEDWIYPVVNNGAITAGGMGYTAKNNNYNSVLFLVVPRTETIDEASVTVPARFFGGLSGGNERNGYLSSIDLKQYSSSSVFTAGTVNVWGYV